MVRKIYKSIAEHPRVQQIGPGLITGAADDDPSGIATYSQAGAQFGFHMLWTMIFTYPLMVGIQMVSARLGCITGRGLAANVKAVFPRPVLYGIVGLLLVANTINVAADIAAMGEALRLLIGGSAHLYSRTLRRHLPGPAGLPALRNLRALPEVADAGSAFLRGGGFHDPRPVGAGYSGHSVSRSCASITTPSPWWWPCSGRRSARTCSSGRRPRKSRISRPSRPAMAAGNLLPHAEAVARQHLRRIRWDTYLGMGFSNLIAFFIILGTAATLHAAGITHIETAGQAAEALRPIGGPATFLLFSLGIIGTGMLAVPVLAGSAAYAVAESFEWSSGLDCQGARGARVLRHRRGRHHRRRDSQLHAPGPDAGPGVEC